MVKLLFSIVVNSAPEIFGGVFVQPTFGNIRLSLCPAPQLTGGVGLAAVGN
jgi:hypothetical protein